MTNRNAAYRWRKLAGDISGGGIAALIALPYGLAMAGMMGLPPVLGVVTSVVTAPVTALLGRNPLLIGGTASATVPFIAEAVRKQGVGGAAKVCLAASVFMLVFSVLKLGRHIQKVPQTVVTGFSCGIGAMMVLSQLGVMLGIKGVVDRTSTNLLWQTWQILSQAGHAQANAILLSVLVVAGAFLSARFFPRGPAPLVGVLLSVAVAFLFGIHQTEVGNLPLELPSFAGFLWSPADVAHLLPTAFGLAFVSSVNILITSRVIEHFRGRHKHLKPTDADPELGAFGIANIFAAIFGAPMSVGIPARSLAAVRCGATTRLANLFHALFVVGFLVVGAGYISRIPVAALAGVTAYVGICLLEWSTWRRLPRMRRLDALAFLATAIAVLAVNAVLAVAIGCSFYLAAFACHWLRGRLGRHIATEEAINAHPISASPATRQRTASSAGGSA